MQIRPYAVVVDDDQAMCRALVRLLRSSNFEVAAFQLGRDALLSINDREPDCIVIDIELPDFKGLDLFTWIQQAHPHVPVVIITAWEDDELRAKALARDAAGFFYKPFSDDVFLQALHTSIAQRRGEPSRANLPRSRDESDQSN